MGKTAIHINSAVLYSMVYLFFSHLLYLEIGFLYCGIYIICSIRVGNELGARRPKTARFSVIVVVVTCFIISVILAIGILILKKELAMAFTSTTVVIRAVYALIPLLAISVLLNGTQPILSGWNFQYQQFICSRKLVVDVCYI